MRSSAPKRIKLISLTPYWLLPTPKGWNARPPVNINSGLARTTTLGNTTTLPRKILIGNNPNLPRKPPLENRQQMPRK